MKPKIYCGLLALAAAALVALRLMKGSFSNAFAAAAAFPFEQIGLGLRALSLTGRPGNAAALALYTALCLLPAFFLLRAARKRKLHAEDALPVLASALLFAVLYWMANPGRIASLFAIPGEAALASGKAMLGICLYGVFVGYAVLRVLRFSFESEAKRLHGFIRALLMLVGLLFVWAVFYGCFGGLIDSIAALRAGNTARPGELGPSIALLILRFLIDSLPYALDIAGLLLALRLIDEMRVDRYAQSVVDAARRLSRFCARALAAVVSSNIGFNLLQLVFAKRLFNIESMLSLPVLSVLFVLAALFFARITAENQALKQDSDLII